MKHAVALVLGLAACARGSSMTAPDATGGDAAPTDGAVVDADEVREDAPGSTPDAPPQTPTGSLLLTEVVLTVTAGEYIEIANPTSSVIDLSTYYLSDSGNYFRVPGGASVDSTDFIVQFPAGATIAPKAVITVAINSAADFQTTYGAAPTYTIASGTGTMREIVRNGTPALTNSGELVALFHWDGQTDLVQDVDLMIVGVPTTGNGLVDKSGAALDGPDPDSTTSGYATDANTLAAQASTPAQTKSTKRILLETGHELQNGRGNGLTGDDETSENTGATWDTTFTAPTPGSVPAGLLP